jgi:hypothetical protein
LSDEEIEKYIKLVEPNGDWKELKDQLWRSCSSLGDPGTKEKEKNIQEQIFTHGKDVK